MATSKHFIIALLLCTPLLTYGLICPDCLCPPENSLICARQEGSGSLRGFSSECVMECSNKCRKKKYVFAFKGRCGKRRKNPRMPFFYNNGLNNNSLNNSRNFEP